MVDDSMYLGQLFQMPDPSEYRGFESVVNFEILLEDEGDHVRFLPAMAAVAGALRVGEMVSIPGMMQIARTREGLMLLKPKTAPRHFSSPRDICRCALGLHTRHPGPLSTLN